MRRRVGGLSFWALLLCLCGTVGMAHGAQEYGAQEHGVQGYGAQEHAWALGWDHGMTLRYRPAAGWIVSLAAGPDDYLHKAELRATRLADSDELHGLLQMPRDEREEHGWARLQLDRELRREGPFAIRGFGGLTYEWYNHQERLILLNDLIHDYDTSELDRHTDRWILTLGMRPVWQVKDWLTIETAFGLRFIHDQWDQTRHRTYAGVSGRDVEITDGKDQYFQDFGCEGAASVQVFLWFW